MKSKYAKGLQLYSYTYILKTNNQEIIGEGMISIHVNNSVFHEIKSEILQLNDVPEGWNIDNDGNNTDETDKAVDFIENTDYQLEIDWRCDNCERDDG